MPKFMKPLVVLKREDGRWEVYEDLQYHVGSKDSGEIILVKKGFQTDFASVPRGLWNIFPPDGKWSPAAVVHDYLYNTRGISGKYTREQCDKIFAEAMQVLDVPLWKRYAMFYAVRAGGWVYWNKK